MAVSFSNAPDNDFLKYLAELSGEAVVAVVTVLALANKVKCRLLAFTPASFPSQIERLRREIEDCERVSGCGCVTA